MRDRIKKILKEDNEFDWVRESNPVSEEEIIIKMSKLRSAGYRGNPKRSTLTTAIYNLGLHKEQLEPLFKALYTFTNLCHGEGIDIGHQEGYSEGYNEGHREGYDEGWDDAKSEISNEIDNVKEESYDNGYNEGYNEAIQEGYQKGYEEGVEETYHKAFEEGRAYEAGIEVEDIERRESGFDPFDYDEDYEKNY